MRIGFLIGALNSGGSERQVSELAAGMLSRGHEVEIAAYDGPGAFDGFVQERAVGLRLGEGGSRAAKLRWVRKWVQEFNPDVLHGVMKRASSLAVLSNLPGRRVRVVGSDLSTATYSRRQPALWGALCLFGFANKVSTQTETNRRSLVKLAPWLRRKVVVVRNGCDTVRFFPKGAEQRKGPFRFLCSGTVYRVKNPVRVVEAVKLLRDRGLDFTIDWAGSTGQGGVDSPDYVKAVKLVESFQLCNVMRFLGPQDRMEDIYPTYDALVHVSLQEGIPNAVVEAMSCGLPIVVSQVSDLPSIVAEGRNGFVCDHHDSHSIADAMQAMLEVNSGDRLGMSTRSRELAVRWFGRDRFLDEYEQLYRSLVGRRG